MIADLECPDCGRIWSSRCTVGFNRTEYEDGWCPVCGAAGEPADDGHYGDDSAYDADVEAEGSVAATIAREKGSR